jgi:DnaJ-class molecular chaperone
MSNEIHENNDYYEILDLPKDATHDDIKKQFRKKARLYHPDKTQGDKDKEEQFKLVVKAYDTLSNPQKRQQYDLLGSEGCGDFQMNEDEIFTEMTNIFNNVFSSRDIFNNLIGIISDSSGRPINKDRVNQFWQMGSPEPFGNGGPGAFEGFSSFSVYTNLGGGFNMTNMNSDTSMIDVVNNITDTIKIASQCQITRRTYKVYIDLDDIINGCTRQVGNDNDGFFNVKISRGVKHKQQITKNVTQTLEVSVIVYHQIHLQQDIKLDNETNDVYITLPITLYDYYCGFQKEIVLGKGRMETICLAEYIDFTKTPPSDRIFMFQNKGIPKYKEKGKLTDLHVTLNVTFPAKKDYDVIQHMFLKLLNRKKIKKINKNETIESIENDDEKEIIILDALFISDMSS